MTKSRNLRHRWTQDHIKFLEDNYVTLGASGVALALNRTEEAIRIKASKLKLKFFTDDITTFCDNENRITHSGLLKILDYNSQSGTFTYKVNRNSHAIVGTVAGSISESTGYVSIMINDRHYLAHRLAWFTCMVSGRSMTSIIRIELKQIIGL